MTQGLSAGYVPATLKVDLPGGSGFAVRGLSLTDITTIYRDHAGELGLWFERITQTGEIRDNTAATMINGLLSATPELAAAIVAGGAGVVDPEAAATLTDLPLGVQFDAIMKIGELTFTADMPPKKVMEIVISLAGNVAMTSLVEPVI